MSQFNSISSHNTDFRSLIKELSEAFSIPQFYHVLGQAEISLNAGFIDDREFSAICEVASLLDPVLYNRWERGGEQ